MRLRNPVIADFSWAAMIVLALWYGCDVKEARGQGVFDAWRPCRPRGQMICPPNQCGPGRCGQQQQSFGRYVPPTQRQQAPAAQSMPGLRPDARCQKFTVRVIQDSPEGNRAAHGNGSLLAVDDTRGGRLGLVLTCAHTQRGTWRPSILRVGVDPKTPATVIDTESAYDLMLLEAPVSRPTTLVPLAPSPATPGTSVFWEGYVGAARPDGLVTGYGALVYTGPVLGIDNGYLRIRGKTRDGQSGGPIYNSDGLYSIVTGSDTVDNSWGVTGPPLDYIRRWIAKSVTIDANLNYTLVDKTGSTEPDPPLPPVVDIPLPDADTLSPPPSGQPPCAGIEALTKRVEAIERRLKEGGPDSDKLAATILLSLKQDAEFHAAVASLVKVPQGQDDPADLAKKIQPHLDPITFRHIDGETKEVFKAEEQVRLGEGYQFVRWNIDWEKAAKKIAPHLPQPQQGAQ